MRTPIKLLLLVACLVVHFNLQGCAISNLPENLSRSMMNQENVELVRTAAPAYLLMLDALVETYPDDEDFLIPAAKLYGAYASAFADDKVQTKNMANRAFQYARHALCEEEEALCAATDINVESIQVELNNLDEDEIPLVYTFASAWAGSIQVNSDDWGAVAQLPKVKTLFTWIISLDPGFDNGTAQIYMGVLESQLPPSLGGRPDLAKMHFEKAISLSNERNLMAKVLYAQQYARLMFEQELHDQLLNEVLAVDAKAEGLTLMNLLAKQQAAELLAESEEYF